MPGQSRHTWQESVGCLVIVVKYFLNMGGMQLSWQTSNLVVIRCGEAVVIYQARGWRGRLSPARSLLPAHDWDRGEAVEGRPLDHPRAIRQIHQRPVRQIDHAHGPRLFEDERGLHAKHFGLCGQLRELHGDRADLPTREAKAGWDPLPRLASLSSRQYALARDDR